MVRIGALTILLLLSGMVSAASCGNGNAEGNEECDGADLRGYSCWNLCQFDIHEPGDYNSQYQSGHGDYNCGSLGSLSCGINCKFKTTCHRAICGDGIAEDQEECDNGNANSDVAPDSCRSVCVLPRCGDDVTDSGEQCDIGPRNSDQIPNTCRTDCRNPHCGDGVLDSGEECDDGNLDQYDGCHQCRKCYVPKDNLRIESDARLCTGEYALSDSGEEGVIIVSGSGLTLDCDGAALVGPSADLASLQANTNLIAIIPTTTSTIKTTATTMKTLTTLPRLVVTSSTTTLKATTTTIYIPRVVANVGLIQTTSTTASTTTTIRFAYTSNTINRFALATSTTSTTLKKKTFSGYTMQPLYANPNAQMLRGGTGIRVSGNNVLLINCDVRDYRTGIRVGGSGNVLLWNRACGNSEDIKSDSPSNRGLHNSCASAPSWVEDGQAGCMRSCLDVQTATEPAAVTLTTTSTTQPKATQKQTGLLSRITGLLFGGS